MPSSTEPPSTETPSTEPPTADPASERTDIMSDTAATTETTSELRVVPSVDEPQPVGPTRAGALRDRLRRYAIGLAPFALLTLVNAVWLVLNRRGRALDIDEAGYISISLRDHLGGQNGGLTGWYHAIVDQPVQAPLAPALASVAHFVLGPGIIGPLLVDVAAFTVLTMATWRIGLLVGGRRVAVLMTLLVGLSPVLLDYSRSFNFAEPTAAFLALALLAAIGSDRFQRPGMALLWGLGGGCMVLARTMTVAFVPGLLLGAVVLAVSSGRLRPLLHVLLGTAVGTGFAAIWYVPNFRSVYDYLTNFGYGAQAAGYGPKRSLLSPTDWAHYWRDMTDLYLYVGLSLLLVLGCAMAVVVAGSRVWANRSRAGLTRLAGSPLVCLGIVGASGLCALMSSRNEGSAFIAPMVVPLGAVAAWGIARLRVPLVALAVVTGLVLLPAAALKFFPYDQVHDRTAMVPALGQLRFWDSRGTLRSYEDAGNPANGGRDKEWLGVADQIVARARGVATREGRQVLVVTTFQHRMVNSNTIGLESLLHLGPYGEQPVFQMDATQPTFAAYQAELTPLKGNIGLMVTATDGLDEFPPTLPAGYSPRLARWLGLHPVQTIPLADGRVLTVWAAR